ncbi:major facilitator superfamily MFS_1 [Kribbella flavida DSM 17836]|uniref:Major facilitator superfamily MFS_1 n=1 Tax=Kribbella flavida (strain DSM 17836 / JCM 10339 / NBRC 14399) TaxID=479435 RepID=D2PUF7_KRIFD|nr:MFS transporter [Kribbella flavida]ADB29475.1 major facilitator superfamily MFS_1 [Kribbella flavida DSM 17836]
MSTTNAPDRLTGRAWAVLLVLCGAIFLEGIDISMMGVALPSIRAELGLTTSELQWVVSAYVLGYGGFVLLGGRAADLLGRRRMFVGWLTVFLVFSGLGGLATEGWMLIVARFITGVAAGFMTPAGLSIITTSYPEGRQRTKALLVYAGIAAAGFSLGMVVGGLLTSIDWRWVFFAPVVLAAVLLPAALVLLPREDSTSAEDAPRTARRFDVPGALILTAAMLLLVATVVRAPDVPKGQTLITLAGGLLLLTAFVQVERRSPAPLIRLGILRNAPLVRANLGAILLVGSFVGFQFIAVLYLQELRHWSELETGLALMVLGIDAVLAPTLTPWLVNRFGVGRVILGGFAVAVAAYALFLPLGADRTYLAMLPTFLLLGLAFALAYGPLTIAATNGVAEEEQGLASGVLTTSFQFGSALGLAAVAAVLAAFDELTHTGLRTALLVPLVAAVLGLLAGAPELARRTARV